jgi:hypothetical protein
MRLLRKTIVLGLAGLGLYKAWEVLGPVLGLAKDTGAQVRDRVEPALREATDTVRSATRDAADTVAGASRDAAGTVVDAVESATPDVGAAGSGNGAPATTPASPASSTSSTSASAG